MSLPLFTFFKYQYNQDGIQTLTSLFRVKTNSVSIEDFLRILFHNLTISI